MESVMCPLSGFRKMLQIHSDCFRVHSCDLITSYYIIYYIILPREYSYFSRSPKVQSHSPSRAHALLHHSGALETRPCDVFGDGAYKRPCACVIFPVSTFPVCSFDGLYISFTHSSMFVLLYLFDARHVGGVGWGGVGGMFTFAVTPLTMLFRLCLLFLMFAVTPLTSYFALIY